MREKCFYSDFFLSVFLRIRTELRSAQMRENTDQKTPNTDTFHAVYNEIIGFNDSQKDYFW